MVTRRLILSLVGMCFLVCWMVFDGFGTTLEGDDIAPKTMSSSTYLSDHGIFDDFESLAEAARNYPQPWIRGKAITRLYTHFRKEAGAVFRDVVKGDKFSPNRNQAALYLAREGDPLGLEYFKKSFADPDLFFSDKLFIVRYMAEVGEPMGYSYLIESANSSDRLARWLSVEILVIFLKFQISDLNPQIDPFEKLLELSRDPNPGVRRKFAFSVPDSGKHSDEFKKAMEALKESDPDDEVLKEAERRLRIWGFPRPSN